MGLKCKIFGHKRLYQELTQDGKTYYVEEGKTYDVNVDPDWLTEIHLQCWHGILKTLCRDCDKELQRQDLKDTCACKEYPQKNIKSSDPKITGHSIKNIHIKHMLMHETEVIEYGPRKGTHDVIRYVCVGGHPTPEKSTWKLEEVTCKNCLRELKTILHKKDWRGIVKAIYDGQLWDEKGITDALNFNCQMLCDSEYEACITETSCPYKQLVTKMNNGMLDCPICGGEKEHKVIISWWQDNTMFGFIPQLPTLQHINLYRCKNCGYIW